MVTFKVSSVVMEKTYRQEEDKILFTVDLITEATAEEMEKILTAYASESNVILMTEKELETLLFGV